MCLHVKSSHDAHRVTTRAAERSHFLVGQSDRENSSWVLVRGKSGMRHLREHHASSGTPTTESLTELEDESRAACRNAMEKLLCTCQERADVLYSVQETARTILLSSGRQEISMKPIVSNFQKSSMCDVCTSSGVVERGEVQPWRLGHGLVTSTTVCGLELCRSRLVRNDERNCRRDGDATPHA